MSTTASDAINNLIRSALADLQPRIEIHRTNIAQAQATLTAEQEELDALLAEDAQYRAALPDGGFAQDVDAAAARLHEEITKKFTETTGEQEG